MKITQSYEYAQSIDAIFAAFTDKAFLHKKLEALGARNISVTISRGGEEAIVKITREMPAEVPGALKKFVKPWNKMSQTEVWTSSENGTYQSNVQIEIVGMPIQMHSASSLTTQAGGCSMETVTDITCSVPFVGGKIAQFVSAESLKALQTEYDYIRTHA